MSEFLLQDIKDAQESGSPTNFQSAIEELLEGGKKSHWIWYVLPQLRSLGRSRLAQRYGIPDLKVAQKYLEDEVLYIRLKLVASIIFQQIYDQKLSLRQLMGSDIDETKAISSLTLFEIAGLKVATPILDRTGRCLKTISQISNPTSQQDLFTAGKNHTQRRGLILGKFAPFHKGHQHLIETALSEVDELIVLIYQAKQTTDIPLETRARWIEILYPQVKVIRGVDGPELFGDSSEIKTIQEDYVLNTLGIRGITHFYSSEFYGEHMSKALGAINRVVDSSRTTFPISGTSIRTNPTIGRDWLDPIVYKDTIHNIVFLGGPGTGKTTVVKKLAEVHQTNFMSEYGREYWEKNAVNRRLSKHQLLELALIHIQMEDSLLETSNKFLFTDTNALTTYLFSNYYHNGALPALEKLAINCFQRYKTVFLCDADFPYPDTEDRSGEGNRILLQDQTYKALQNLGIKFTLLSGSLDKRVETVSMILAKNGEG